MLFVLFIACWWSDGWKQCTEAVNEKKAAGNNKADPSFWYNICCLLQHLLEAVASFFFSKPQHVWEIQCIFEASEDKVWLLGMSL